MKANRWLFTALLAGGALMVDRAAERLERTMQIIFSGAFATLPAQLERAIGSSLK